MYRRAIALTVLFAGSLMGGSASAQTLDGDLWNVTCSCFNPARPGLVVPVVQQFFCCAHGQDNTVTFCSNLARTGGAGVTCLGTQTQLSARTHATSRRYGCS